jgi:hypothetical protein
MKPTAAVCLALIVCACASAPPRRGPAPPDRRPREQLFISPAGEPFRSPLGQTPPLDQWWRQVDPAGAGSIAPAAFVQDFERFFATLDADKDGVLSSPEINRYEAKVAPEILPGNGAVRGAAEFGLLNDAEPVLSADANLDGQVTLAEFRLKAQAMFARLDLNKDGRLARSELPRLRVTRPGRARR